MYDPVIADQSIPILPDDDDFERLEALETHRLDDRLEIGGVQVGNND